MSHNTISYIVYDPTNNTALCGGGDGMHYMTNMADIYDDMNGLVFVNEEDFKNIMEYPPYDEMTGDKIPVDNLVMKKVIHVW